VIAFSRRALLASAAGLLVLIALGGLGWFWYRAEQSRALEAYAVAMTRLRATQAPQARPEDRTAALRELEATLARYPSSGAAAEAAYQLAGLRFDSGEYAAARGAYEVVLARGASATLRTLAQAGVGYAWEAEREYAKAVGAYRAALSGLGPKDFYYEVLLEDLARGLELGGQKSEAIQTYQRLLKELPQARRAEEVRARLMLLGAS
jgi:tetratricopeptide (TPR) repeat protein